MNKRIRRKTIRRYADDITVYAKLTPEGKRVCDRWDQWCDRYVKEIVAEIKAEEVLEDAEADYAVYRVRFVRI